MGLTRLCFTRQEMDKDQAKAFTAQIKELSGGKGVDVIYDPVGDVYAEPAIRAMAWNGRYLVIGFAAGEIPKMPLNLTLLKGCSIVGVFWGQFTFMEAELSAQNNRELMEMEADGRIKPHVSKVFSFEQTAEAIAHIGARQANGQSGCGGARLTGLFGPPSRASRFVHKLRQLNIKLAKTADIMGRERDFDCVIDIKPFWVMVHLFSPQGHPRHPCKSCAEAGKNICFFQSPRARVFFQLGSFFMAARLLFCRKFLKHHHPLQIIITILAHMFHHSSEKPPLPAFFRKVCRVFSLVPNIRADAE